MWSGTSTTAKNNKQLLKMVDAVLSSSVAGQLHAWNPTSALKDVMVEFVFVSVVIHVCDVKQTKASRQAAAGLKNFAWSTGKPMGRPREPRGRRPCGRSRKHSPAQVKKRIKMKAAGMQPGPGPAKMWLCQKLCVCPPAMAVDTSTQDEAVRTRNRSDPADQAATPFATAPSRYPGRVASGCSVALTKAKAASSAAKATKYHADTIMAFAGHTAWVLVNGINFKFPE